MRVCPRKGVSPRGCSGPSSDYHETGGSKLRERLPLARETIEVDVYVRAESVHGDQAQVAPKVPRVQSREREAVAEPGHGRVEIARLEVLIDVLALHGGVHVRPDERYRAARYPATLVRDLDRDVLLALDDDHLDRRDLVLLVVPVPLHDRAERVLEQLKADVGQVTGHVREMQVVWADQLHGRALEHPVMLLADVARVLDRLVDDVIGVLYGERRIQYCQTVMKCWGGLAPRILCGGSLTARVHMIPT